MSDEVYRSRLDMLDTCMLMAHTIAQARSKDPRSKVGACAYHAKTGGFYLGWNGFPAGFPDLKRYWDNRDTSTLSHKYLFCIHAELNAIRKAHQALGTLEGVELFVTHFPCKSCTKDAISMSGIKRVYYASSEHYDALSLDIAYHSGIEFIQRDLPASVL